MGRDQHTSRSISRSIRMCGWIGPLYQMGSKGFLWAARAVADKRDAVPAGPPLASRPSTGSRPNGRLNSVLFFSSCARPLRSHSFFMCWEAAQRSDGLAGSTAAAPQQPPGPEPARPRRVSIRESRQAARDSFVHIVGRSGLPAPRGGGQMHAAGRRRRALLSSRIFPCPLRTRLSRAAAAGAACAGSAAPSAKCRQAACITLLLMTDGGLRRAFQALALLGRTHARMGKGCLVKGVGILSVPIKIQDH